MATPFFAFSSERPKTAFEAPRTLKAPAFCRFSHLKNSEQPASSSMKREVRIGVRWMYGRTRSCAASTSS